MTSKNFYHILGVKRDASQKDIKIAYRRLARKYHPDVSTLKNAVEKFKAMGEAYEVLKNPQSREQYDQLYRQKASRKTAKRKTSRKTPKNKHRQYGFDEQGFNERHTLDLNAHFKNIFGKTNSNTRSYAVDGKDYYIRAIIDKENALNGSTKEFVVDIPVYTPQGDIQIKKKTIVVKIPCGIKEGETIRLNKKGIPGMGSAAGDCYLEIAFSKQTRTTKTA